MSDNPNVLHGPGHNAPAPWMAAIEAQLDGVRLLDSILSKLTTLKLRLKDAPLHKRLSAAPRIDLEKQWKVDHMLMTQATPFLWTRETQEAVMAASRSVPNDTVINTWNLDTEAVWWYFDQPLPIQTVNDASLPIHALSAGWVYGIDYKGNDSDTKAFVITAWIPYTSEDDPGYGKLRPSQVWTWYPNESLDHMLRRVRAEHRELYGPDGRYEHTTKVGEDTFCRAADIMSRFIMAGFAWMNQKVLVLGDGHIQRQRRKEFTKLTRNHEVSSVRVIQLRKAEHVKTLDDNPPTDREEAYYSCRFTVDGHWRNQACGPKFSDRRLTWINSFLKGPDDAPLKVPRQKVYVVTR